MHLMGWVGRKVSVAIDSKLGHPFSNFGIPFQVHRVANRSRLRHPWRHLAAQISCCSASLSRLRHPSFAQRTHSLRRSRPYRTRKPEVSKMTAFRYQYQYEDHGLSVNRSAGKSVAVSKITALSYPKYRRSRPFGTNTKISIPHHSCSKLRSGPILAPLRAPSPWMTTRSTTRGQAVIGERGWKVSKSSVNHQGRGRLENEKGKKNGEKNRGDGMCVFTRAFLFCFCFVFPLSAPLFAFALRLCTLVRIRGYKLRGRPMFEIENAAARLHGRAAGAADWTPVPWGCAMD